MAIIVGFCRGLKIIQAPVFVFARFLPNKVKGYSGIRIWRKNTLLRLVKCLLCKHEDTSSNPQQLLTSQMAVYNSNPTAGRGNGDRQILGAHWLYWLTNQQAPGFNERSCPPKIRQKVLEENTQHHPGEHACRHACTRAGAHTHTEACMNAQCTCMHSRTHHSIDIIKQNKIFGYRNPTNAYCLASVGGQLSIILDIIKVGGFSIQAKTHGPICGLPKTPFH